MNGKMVCTLLTVLVLVTPLHAQERTGTLSNIRNRAPLIFGLEYFKPTEGTRQLKTSNINLIYPIKTVESTHLALYAGLTFTRVTGEITQHTGSLQAGTLRQATYENSATGIGPDILAKIGLFRLKRLSGTLDVSGAFIVYDRDFPAGGTRYNFMWRIGPSLSYTVGKSSAIGVHYQWLHVSNGKAIDNPSYDAKGFGIQLSHVF